MRHCAEDTADERAEMAYMPMACSPVLSVELARPPKPAATFLAPLTSYRNSAGSWFEDHEIRVGQGEQCGDRSPDRPASAKHVWSRNPELTKIRTSISY
jgi:hypothetical protein